MLLFGSSCPQLACIGFQKPPRTLRAEGGPAFPATFEKTKDSGGLAGVMRLIQLEEGACGICATMTRQRQRPLDNDVKPRSFRRLSTPGNYVYT